MRQSIPLIFIAFIGACSDNNGNTGGNGSGQDMAASVAACDVVKQDCPSGQKCVPKVKGADLVVIGSACVPNGTVAEGQPCVPKEADPSLLNSDCVAGTQCDDTGANAASVCRKYCGAGAACSNA